MTTVVPTFRVYRGAYNIIDNSQNPNTWRAFATYVTGAHNMKFGYQGQIRPCLELVPGGTQRSAAGVAMECGSNHVREN